MGIPEKRAFKDDSFKTSISLIDPEFRAGMARVLAMGEKKYGRQNWRQGNGLAHSRIIDATHRHLMAIEMGDVIDDESGELHAYHVACNMMMLAHMQYGDIGVASDSLPFAKRPPQSMAGGDQ